MKSTESMIRMSESIKRNPSGNRSKSFCIDIMCLALPNTHLPLTPMGANLCGYFSSSLSKSMNCPLVLSMTRTFFIFFVHGSSSELSKITTL